MDWMDFDKNGIVDDGERFFAEEMLCANKKEHEELFGDDGGFFDESDYDDDDYDDDEY